MKGAGFMTLRELLNEIEFDYEFTEGTGEFDGHTVIKLIDTTGAYWGSIADEQYDIDYNPVQLIIERLDKYWDDYFVGGLAEDTGLSVNDYYEDIYNAAVAQGIKDYRVYYLYYILHPADVQAVFTWDDLYDRAAECSFNSWELRAKDEARNQLRSLIIDEKEYDIEKCESPEEEIDVFLSARERSVLFDEDGNIIMS